MVKISLVLLLILSFYGCATTSSLNNISLGMTKTDVIKTMGNPNSVSAQDNVEYLKYNLSPAIRAVNDSIHNYDYFVRLVNGKVESYGKVGDFDSTKDQTNIIKLETQK